MLPGIKRTNELLEMLLREKGMEFQSSIEKDLFIPPITPAKDSSASLPGPPITLNAEQFRTLMHS